MDVTAAKGTVTSFSSMFPFDEAQKAVKQVEDKIAEKHKELDKLREFIADNTGLINLVSRLPDELHHDVMVPFGKAAFFPGRLIHTNELVVLLGEGYYAERTAKQTLEILKRRGKALDSQVESLKANIKDLGAEASFFDSTAAEAAEGLVEIREDYVEENFGEGQTKSETDGKKVMVEDDEYARIMSRLDELEKEELAAEGVHEIDEDEHTDTVEIDNESDENEQTNTVESDNESDEDGQTNATKRGNNNHFQLQTHLETNKSQKQTKVESASIEALSNKCLRQLDITDQPNCTGLTGQPIPKDDVSNSKNVRQIRKPIPTEKALLPPEAKEKFEAVSSMRNEEPIQTTKSGFDSSKAFTGSIVERTLGLPTSHEQTANSSKSSDSQSSKPVSRFKMQRR